MACFLRGSGGRANYERLREACQTDVDGTSIDTLEDVAKQSGVDCVQHLLPADSFLEEARSRLPVIAVVTTGAGYPHFVVLWRTLGPYWQIMDPARGRRWVHRDELRSLLHVHVQRFEPGEFRRWAEQSSFFFGLQKRVWALASRTVANRLLTSAVHDPSWKSLAALDAAARFVEALRKEASSSHPSWGETLLVRSFEIAITEADAPVQIPPAFWAVRAVRGGRAVAVSGSVMLGSSGAVPPLWRGTMVREDQAAQLHRALSEPEPSLLDLLKPLLDQRMWWLLGILGLVAAVSVAVALVEVLVIRIALSDLRQFAQSNQQLGVMGWLVSLFSFMFLLDLTLALGQRSIGRRIEVRLRLALFGALPALDEQFIRSRPTSDLAQRAQVLHLVRELPATALAILRGAVGLASTLAVIGMLDWMLAVLVTVSVGALVLVGSATGLKVHELERKLQSNNAALLHVFQDALLGVVPLRVHGAEIALRREHRSKLVAWFGTQRERLGHITFAQTIQGLLVSAILALILLRGHALFADGARLVMLLFWVLRIPVGGQELLGGIQSFPSYRLALARALEPVRGRAAAPTADAEVEHTRYGTGQRGARIQFEGVHVIAGGLLVLDDVSLTIDAGEHVAIVGRSGAGKSTLLSLLLGLRAASRGTVKVDDQLLEGEALHTVRRQTAWIDPGVQLWNDAFLANLMYGQDDVPHRSMNSVLDLSDLVGVIERLPAGLKTRVGSDGTLLSGGEGQRLRVGRALLNTRPRLALLDEPFRGLDRDLRKKMLQNVRDAFCRETLVVVTHDVEHVGDFDRVLVVEDGRIIEDDAPAELMKRSSRFRELYEGDLINKDTVWSDGNWTRVKVERGLAHTEERAATESNEAHVEPLGS